MLTACVIGHPITHSRSPLIHGTWLKEFGIDGQYLREDVRPDQLEQFFHRLRAGEFVGCNVTLPHKEMALRHVDHSDERVARTGSLNTVYVRKGKLHATSTDGEGFAANIHWHHNSYQFSGSTVVMLGAGGSARSIADELLRRGVGRLFIANRNIEKAEAIAETFGQSVSAISYSALTPHLPTADLVINTTSAGISDDGKIAFEFDRLPASALVADINYVPFVTSFLREAKAAGLKIVPGLGMLLHQAVRGFELWFGQRPVVTTSLHDTIARDIDLNWQPGGEA